MTTENLTFSNVRSLFHHDAVAVSAYPSLEDRFVNFNIEVACQHLDWQLSSVVQIFTPISLLIIGSILYQSGRCHEGNET